MNGLADRKIIFIIKKIYIKMLIVQLITSTFVLV